MQANAFEQISAYEAISFHLCELFHGGLIYFFRFHTYDYARHFVSACTRILGLEGTPEGVEDQGRLTRVAAVIIKTNVFLSYVVDVLKVYCNLIPFS
jgi:trehalose-6-phosphate synthase